MVVKEPRKNHQVIGGQGLLPVVLTLTVIAVPALAQPDTGTIRVRSSGTDSGACGAAATPCRTIQHAVNLAGPGDVIKVATGTYSSTTSCLGSPAVVCVLNKHTTIRGGFPAGNWSTPTPATTPTILDGLDANRVVLVQDTTIDATNSASLTLEGVTVTRGFVQGASSGNESAIAAQGAGINATNVPLALTDVTISFNRALGGGTSGGDHGGAGAGGGIGLFGSSDFPQLSVFLNVVFEGNVAEGGGRSGGGAQRGGYGQGGGLFVFQSRLEGYDLTFRDNQALGGDAPSATGSDPGGQEADAQGAGACIQVGSDVTLDGVTAHGNVVRGGDARNSSGGLGGGAFGPAVFSELATLTLRNFSLWANQALGGDAFEGGLGGGGALTVAASVVVVEAGEMFDNLSKGGNGTSVAGSAGGGAVYSTGNTTIDVTNVVMADNAAELGDLGSAGAGGAGAMFLQSTTGSVVHATLARNRLSSSNMQGEAAALLGSSNVDFDYTIFADHTSIPGELALHVQPGNAATLQRGIFSGNGQDAGGGGTINGLGTMLALADVGFVSPGAPSFDYHLQESSPAIDQATGSATTTDIDGETRTSPDIGADEFVRRDEIFSDGFESGNTSAWSATVP